MKKDKWIYETPEQSELEQGAYYRTNHEGEKCAVILPIELDKPIGTGGNAMLLVREYGSKDWKTIEEAFSLEEAKERGDEHVHQYAHDLANHMLEYAEEDGFEMFGDQVAKEEDLDQDLDL